MDAVSKRVRGVSEGKVLNPLESTLKLESLYLSNDKYQLVHK